MCTFSVLSQYGLSRVSRARQSCLISETAVSHRWESMRHPDVRGKVYIRKGRDVYTWRRRCIYVKTEMYIHKGRDVLSWRTWRIMAKEVTDYGERGNGFWMDLIIFSQKSPASTDSGFFSAGICFQRGGESVDAGDFWEKVFILMVFVFFVFCHFCDRM